MPPTNNEELQVNNIWGTAAPLNVTTLLTCPSGQVVKAQRLGMEGIMSSGLLGDADSLTAYVGKRHLHKVRGGKEADNDELNMSTLMRDPEALKRIVFLMDRAMPLIVVEPEVLLHLEYLDRPAEDGATTRMIPPEERKDGAIYTDQVGFEDKMFLFQFCTGGSGNLERFRSELDATVESLPVGEDVPSAAVAGVASTGRKRARPRRR
jgi:hypothetical protein